MAEMIKKLFMLLCLLCAMTATAQVVKPGSARTLVDSCGFFPQLSPDGLWLLYSPTDATQLMLKNLSTGTEKVIAAKDYPGFDAIFGGDGKVYYVTQEVREDRLVYRTGQCFDALTGKSTLLTEPQHGAVRAVPATRGGALKAPGGKGYNSSSDIGSATWTEGSRVHVTVGGEERVFSPVNSWAGYLWASLSPDGRRVAFFAAGKGIVVIDLRGQVLAMLGNYEMPCWYINDYLVAQNAKADGHQFTSSQLLLLKADGTWQTELTKPASMTMQPTCGGGKIVYTSIDGLLYEMTINIHE